MVSRNPVVDYGFGHLAWKKAENIILIKDNRDIAAPLKALFEKAGVAASVVDALPEGAIHVIDLRGLNLFKDPSLTALIQVNKAAFEVARSCGKTLFNKSGMLILPFDSGLSAGGQEKRAWTAGLSALAKTARLEWPEAYVRSIDINCSEKAPEAIANELFVAITSGGSAAETAIDAAGNILGFSEVPAEIAHQKNALKDGDTLIVSGGAKGVTAACLIEWSQRIRLNIGILGRTELEPEPEYLADKSTDAELKHAVFLEAKENKESISPMEVSRIVSKVLSNRAIAANLEKLTRNGAQVKYMSVDIADSEQVNKAVKALRNHFGNIKGIVHAAGVLADKYIHEKTDAQYDKVFNTKIHGFMNLLQATDEDELTHICCFSSVAARMGNPGQADYAMANETLNKVCQAEQHKRKDSCLVKSINWGPWDGGMVSDQLKKHFEAMGVALIPVELGAKMFADEMEDASIENVEIVVGGALDGWGNKDDDTPKTRTLWIHHSNSEFLASHEIEGNIVVPMMMVNVWSMRLAKHLYPQLNVTAVNNMKVFKGIELKNFDTVGDILIFNYDVKTLENSAIVHIKIENDAAQLLYSVSVVLADRYDVSEKKKTPLEHLDPWKTAKKAIYTHKLFHGPAFQVIGKLEGISDTACSAWLNIKDIIAGNAAIPSDMLLYDGGIQLAILAMDAWTGNNASLPMGYESLNIYEDIEKIDELHCELTATKKGDANSEWDIRFKNKDDKILAELSGLTMYMYQLNQNN